MSTTSIAYSKYPSGPSVTSSILASITVNNYLQYNLVVIVVAMYK
jgi:hypothetical protein